MSISAPQQGVPVEYCAPARIERGHVGDLYEPMGRERKQDKRFVDQVADKQGARTDQEQGIRDNGGKKAKIRTENSPAPASTEIVLYAKDSRSKIRSTLSGKSHKTARIGVNRSKEPQTPGKSFVCCVGDRVEQTKNPKRLIRRIRAAITKERKTGQLNNDSPTDEIETGNGTQNLAQLIRYTMRQSRAWESQQRQEARGAKNRVREFYESLDGRLTIEEARAAYLEIKKEMEEVLVQEMIARRVRDLVVRRKEKGDNGGSDNHKEEIIVDIIPPSELQQDPVAPTKEHPAA